MAKQQPESASKAADKSVRPAQAISVVQQHQSVSAPSIGYKPLGQGLEFNYFQVDRGACILLGLYVIKT